MYALTQHPLCPWSPCAQYRWEAYVSGGLCVQGRPESPKLGLLSFSLCIIALGWGENDWKQLDKKIVLYVRQIWASPVLVSLGPLKKRQNMDILVPSGSKNPLFTKWNATYFEGSGCLTTFILMSNEGICNEEQLKCVNSKSEAQVDQVQT